MRILVLGGDGYLGWPTAMYLSAHGHDVGVLDSAVRRQYDHELGSESLVPIESLRARVQAWKEVTGHDIAVFHGDLTDADFTYDAIRTFAPEAIVHFAEQRAAPYSMIDRKHAVYTQTNNIVGTLNVMYAIGELDRDIHLVKLGTMGEYGTPNIDIEEGWLEVTHNGRSDRVLYPKRPGSFYHLSKVHDSHNIMFTCRVWGLRATDLNQGVVYGSGTPETDMHSELRTRFDYDDVWGTVLNRFCSQAAIGYPLTVHGTGGQTRAFIHIRDTVRCIELALENPPQAGDRPRVLNQVTETHQVGGLAKLVADIMGADIAYLPNPRREADENDLIVTNDQFLALGLEPTRLSDGLLEEGREIAQRYRDRVDPSKIIARSVWRKGMETAEDLLTDVPPEG